MARLVWWIPIRQIRPLGSGSQDPQDPIQYLASERLGLPPAEIVFLDDLQPNVESARACGLQAVHFTSTSQTISDIEALLQG